MNQPLSGGVWSYMPSAEGLLGVLRVMRLIPNQAVGALL